MLLMSGAASWIHRSDYSSTQLVYFSEVPFSRLHFTVFFRIFKNLIYVHIGRFLGNRTKLCRCFTVGFTVLIVDSAEQGMFGLTVFI